MCMCRWSDSTAVSISLDSSSVLSPGEWIDLLVGSVRVEASGVLSSQSAVVVTPPVVKRLPVVSIEAVEVVGACEDLLLDMALSTGTGGRPWAAGTGIDVTTVQAGDSVSLAALQVSSWFSLQYHACKTYRYYLPTDVAGHLYRRE